MLRDAARDIGRDAGVEGAAPRAYDVDVPRGRLHDLAHVPAFLSPRVRTWDHEDSHEMEPSLSPAVAEIMTFAELAVSADLIAAMAKQDITDPMPIQIAALPVLLAGKNAYLNSETGTGKTLAYVLPIFCRLDAQRDATQVVIVAPTHELAIQIQHLCRDLAQHAGRAIRTQLLIGGTSMVRQIDHLKRKPHMVVGSPGRIRELMTMGKLKAQAIGCIVIDEADRLLADTSLADVRAIVRATPAGRQLIFASATEQPQSAAAITALAPDVVMVRAGAASVNA